MNKHPDTFLELDALGMVIPEYRPTFDFAGRFIDESHAALSKCRVKDGHLIEMKSADRKRVIKGWLRREDALKLYEMAYHVSGDILEIGSYHGLSSCILSNASLSSPRRKTFFSVELDVKHSMYTELNLRRQGLFERVRLICGDASSVLPNMARQGKKFGFVFIDHSHTYQATRDACAWLGKIVYKDGFCLFHDFNDSRNADEGNTDYGVYRAVVNGLPSKKFEFYGIYGCAALYKKISTTA